MLLVVERGAVPACPLCGKACKSHDTEPKDWRHLYFWEWKTYMHARISEK
ncbi:transposase family protein [Paenibacillus alba]|nr:transposase family protein [Paenibacillus alba]